MVFQYRYVLDHPLHGGSVHGRHGRGDSYSSHDDDSQFPLVNHSRHYIRRYQYHHRRHHRPCDCLHEDDRCSCCEGHDISSAVRSPHGWSGVICPVVHGHAKWWW